MVGAVICASAKVQRKGNEQSMDSAQSSPGFLPGSRGHPFQLPGVNSLSGVLHILLYPLPMPAWQWQEVGAGGLAFPVPSSGWTGLLVTSLPPNLLVLSGSTFYLNAELCPFSVKEDLPVSRDMQCSLGEGVVLKGPCSHSWHPGPTPLLSWDRRLSTTAPVLPGPSCS